MKVEKVLKRALLCLLLFSFLPVSYGQLPEELVGSWEGKLTLPGIELRLWLKVEKDSLNQIVATVDSPDQGAKDIKVSHLAFHNNTVTFELAEVNASYMGLINDSLTRVKGHWTQGVTSLRLDLIRLDKTPEVLRPQEPQTPYPYLVEDVIFENKSKGIKLSGTLTRPGGETNVPAVVLVSGSGPQNRDSEIFGHKPFHVIADHLSRHGIAVLRYDDRGTGESEGNFSAATTRDLASDANAALQFLKNHKGINSTMTGIIGHSEGGMIAPMVAAKSKEVAFIIMLAGPGSSGEEVLYQQLALISQVNGVSEKEIKESLQSFEKIYAIAKSDISYKDGVKKLKRYFKRHTRWMTTKKKAVKGLSDTQTNAMIQQVMSDWFRQFLTLNPGDYLPDVKCPVLSIIGEKDLQVPPEPNLKLIERYLKEGGNEQAMIHELKGLNHLLQHCETGSLSEYGQIEETIAPEVLELMLTFIRRTCNLRAH